MKHIFIVNPSSGSGKYKKVLEIIEIYFKDKKDQYKVHLTDYIGHATQIAKEYKGQGLTLYCVGGDGTAHEILNGLNEGVSMAIIPVGSGNDFWRVIDYKKSLEDIVIDTIEGQDIKVDYGMANDIRFLNCANTGFDSIVNKEVNGFRWKWFPRNFIYGIFALKGLVAKKSVELTYTINNKTEKKHALLASFMNGSWYGGGFEAAPRAKVRDGLLDVCIVENVSRRRILTLLPAYFKGEHLDMDLDIISFYQVEDLIVESNQPMTFGLDGEIHMFSKVSLSIVDKGLSLRVPINLLID